jgi:hypothetical protein
MLNLHTLPEMYMINDKRDILLQTFTANLRTFFFHKYYTCETASIVYYVLYYIICINNIHRHKIGLLPRLHKVRPNRLYAHNNATTPVQHWFPPRFFGHVTDRRTLSAVKFDECCVTVVFVQFIVRDFIKDGKMETRWI